ncbi:FERM and PDZ domain-containing protein 1 isoform X1 [Girardinichthys multiradiatus]|uniref:FERM and PDZ domain-containing protein 1 isoform X1 n=1 Tax=Girardinichthys multiradiatus TaxID=208333 RepID=UPI001FABD112|nr:FERM and PDZ domain-containing protein 1 isoform X1 [Girardinichthys multiradiatus]XP_047209641.1 FERM and PDZ domain-containing protein 1 isoform X1 [Girardinichthys multiradiatus]XP_047209642.1 FERM and PDZ domain-containing protein 1 isoform X1 [Girardinichthys multiradiatus]
MEENERCRSRSPARRTNRVQQVVGTIIRRTRESLSRERLLGDGRSQRSNSLSSQSFQAKLTLQITRDPVLDRSTGHGFTLTTDTPLLVRDVAPGSPADGILFPGDQVLQINDKVMEDLSEEQVESILRDLEDCINVTILRHMTNPKSSIMSAEKRARLRSNPVKVRFAEEVVVNGHTQGNSLLFLPNVLKVYLENGQTKAFKFDNTTAVKDIVLTLKEKLSIRVIEYFGLVLEQQYSITKLLLLHEDELIQKVVQKKDSHDYRCLFRVCFIPRDPTDLLQDDPMAFEYHFLQSVGDVLQERFAVEMKCNTALRLAALHMHERLDSCGHTRTSIKSITKEFGLDSFISPTLLSNMREKDLRKAISYHLKKIQSLLEPRQKVISATQARLAYLAQLGEVISYGARSYTATMMLQDREVLVSLLVGAKYGLSQVINHKLNMISTLVEFSSISRVELLSESDKVSLLRISLHDMKPFALLMDSMAAKDLGCLLGGYCKLLVDPSVNVFRLGRPKVRVHRIPAEEGVCGRFAVIEGVCYESLSSYVSRCCSDSDDSTDDDDPMDSQSYKGSDPASTDWEERRREEEEKRKEEERKEREEHKGKQEVKIIVTSEGKENESEEEVGATGSGLRKFNVVDEEMNLETNWYHTDPRVTSSFSSLSSSSLSTALDESSAAAKAPCRLDAFRGSSPGEDPSNMDVHHPYLLETKRQGPLRPTNLNYCGNDNSFLCFADLSKADFLPSPAGATSDDDDGDDDDEEEEDLGIHKLRCISKIPSSRDLRMIDSTPFERLPIKRKKKTPPKVPVRTSSIPGNKSAQAEHRLSKDADGLFLTPSPNPKPALLLKDNVSESEDEFFDAQERFTPPVPELSDAELADRRNANRLSGTWNSLPSVPGKGPSSPVTNKPQSPKMKKESELLKDSTNQLVYRQASLSKSIQKPEVKVKPPLAPKPQLPPKPQMMPPKSPQRGRSYAQCNGDASGHLSSELLEMEPDTMEFKSVTLGGLPLSSSMITAVRCNKQSVTNTTPHAEEKTKKQENYLQQNKNLVSKNGLHVSSSDKTLIPDKKETAKVDEKVNGSNILTKSPPSLRPITCSNSGTKLAVPPPVPPKPTSSCSFHPLSLPSSSPVSPTDPNKGIFNDTVGTPNGIHPWSSRNGSIQSGPRRVSLSHESLSPKNTDAPLTIATSPTSVDCKGVGAFDSRESGRSGSGSDLRTSSSSLGGRLPASALRGKIQSLPWYMTRSQEILGNLDYPSTSSINGDTSGFGSGLSVASGLSDLNKTPVKDKETIASKSGSKGSILDDGAEVVIATIKEAPELSSHMKKASGTNGSHPNLSFRDNSPHLGSVSSEQPQSRPHSAVGLGGVTIMQIGGDSPTSSGADTTPPQQHRESCGCRTVYANCFSGDTEDGVSFDEELTVYEFSRRICPKPAQASSPTIPSPKPNILSLLRDNPRPLSTFSTASTELSPLVSCPVSPTVSLSGRLRSLTNKNYGGLRGGFVSLREDIDQLLLVLEKGVLDQSQHPSKLENTDLNHNGTEDNTAARKVCTGISPVIMTESERSLLQAEARRLASGCQRATRVGWAPDEALRSLTTSFSALVQLSAACLKTNPCPGCDVCHKARLVDRDEDDDGQQPMDKLKEIVGLYREFVGAVETAGTGGVNSGRSVGSGQSQGEEDGVRLLAKRCTLLISSVFALTQLFRTCTLETTETPGRVPLNF